MAAEDEVAEIVLPSGDRSEIILLVEDDEAVRELSAAMLGELGYGVVKAEDGATALRLLEGVPGIRLLFTDIGLPGGLDGRQLADLVLRARPDLKVLYTSGYARNAILYNGGLEPGIALIAKPFPMAALATKIRDVLDRP
jgi:CheY-like chemotaxis protein